MNSLHDVEERRIQILDQLRAMRSLKRGTINEQFIKDTRKKGSKPVVRGPYYVFSRRERGKTVSRRLKTSEELEQARREIAEHERFVGLCRELEELTERLGELTRNEQSQEKKRRRSSNKIKS